MGIAAFLMKRVLLLDVTPVLLRFRSLMQCDFCSVR